MSQAANNSAFTHAEVRLVRTQSAAGTLDIRKWADAKGVSLETVRRIARRDTYRDVPDFDEPKQLDEPDAEAIAASLRKLQQAVDSTPPQPREVGDLLDQLRRGELPK